MAAALREDMVKRAVGFLRHPKVVGAPKDKQTQFLRDKQLTQPEIEEALKRVAQLEDEEASAKTRAALASAPTRRFIKGSIRSEAVVSGGIVYISEQTAQSPAPASGGRTGDDKGGSASVAESLSAEQQATVALENVKRLLQEAGSSPSKVLSALLCVRDLGQDLDGVDRAWAGWVDKENPPARTVVQTEAFAAAGGGADNGLRFSVSVTAHL